jgi:hypothetical protein
MRAMMRGKVNPPIANKDTQRNAKDPGTSTKPIQPTNVSRPKIMESHGICVPMWSIMKGMTRPPRTAHKFTRAVMMDANPAE